MTAFTPERISQMRLDAAKLVFRLDLSAPASLHTLEYCAKALDRLYDLASPRSWSAWRCRSARARSRC